MRALGILALGGTRLGRRTRYVAQWRGPNRDATRGSPFPAKLDTLKQSWRVELVPGVFRAIVLADA